MHFRIAATFTDSLARLTGDEQKAAKTTAFDLQINPASPGLKFHKLDRARDRNFWSVRVSSDIRLIVHKTAASLLLCYVDHHDKAYDWAERRKLETHPKTGAAQLVEIRERVEEIVVPKYVEVTRPSLTKPALFADKSNEELLAYGVPIEWLHDVRRVDEDSLLVLADHLPSEAAEALLELATGGRPALAHVAVPRANPFDHPDAQRRFRIMNDVEELERALAYPWEKWTIFLHPAQKEWVERDYNGPARVAGSAGTGKTVVALHRAVHLARTNHDARVLLTTFSDTLASALGTKLKRLIGSERRLSERLEVLAIDAIGERLYDAHFGTPQFASREVMRQLLTDVAIGTEGQKLAPHFLLTEWEEVVDAWQLRSWEAYRDVKRLGRMTRLPEPRRAVLWTMFERVRQGLQNRGLITRAEMFGQLAEEFLNRKQPPFDFVVVDEAQDISVAQLRFLAALGANRPNSLLFAGDLGQRIFQQPFSWKALGVDIRGRARTLQINYRTSHQIRTQADRLLGASVTDVDGVTQARRGTISVFNGAAPEVMVFDNAESESRKVGAWLLERGRDNVQPHEMGVFVRSMAELGRARTAVQAAGLPFSILDNSASAEGNTVSLCTMHLAKGLEFRAVAVMACDDEALPLQNRIEMIADHAELEEVYATERHLLYVACTRARDHLLITGVTPASEFLDDLVIGA